MIHRLSRRCFKNGNIQSISFNVRTYSSTNEIPIVINDSKSEHEKLIEEMEKSSNKNLILWKGLKDLYCIKKLQNIEHFPSDLLWCHKTKNLYLLELDRAIKEEKWREWLNICYGVIKPLNNDDNNDNIIHDNTSLPPKSDFIIDSNSLKTLIPFLIEQTVNDKNLKNEILNKLTTIHSEKILNQFRNRIERSDIKYNTYKRNKYIDKYGNIPLKKYIYYDYEFKTIIYNKLNELNKIDNNLYKKFIECWSINDNIFIGFTTTNEITNETRTNELDVGYKCWSNNIIDSDSGINIPLSYRTHNNLLRHTIDDCSKLTLLNYNLLLEGYTGDNGHNKYGLWKSNNLPIILIRPYLLKLRDIICDNNNLGSYIEIIGKYGTGKSITLMYCVNIIRQMNDWLCIYCPNTHEWIQNIQLTIPANDKASIFYQNYYAREFFNKMKISESEKLKNININGSNTYNINNNNNNDKINLDIIYEMLEDPIDIKKYEKKILNEWMKYGNGIENDIENNEKCVFNNLYEMCEYGSSINCQHPASLMYEFINEIKNQTQYKILIACDNINWWNDFIYGLSTPRNPKVFAWQLSMIDIFSQFQQINSLPNGMTIMSHTTMGKSRKPQFKTYPSHIINCPDFFTNDEFDSIIWNYKGIKLCSNNIAPDDYKKIYAASARRPIYAQRIAALY